MDPQPSTATTSPAPRAMPFGMPVAAPLGPSHYLPAKAPPPGLNPPRVWQAPLPANAPPKGPPTVKAPPEEHDFWNHEERAETPITVTVMTLEERVKATEKRITDNVNDKIGQLMVCVRDLERQVVLLREEVAIREPVATTKDQGTDPAEEPAPPVVEDWWSKQWNAQTKASRESWNHTDTVGSTGGNLGEEAQNSWQHDTRWSRTNYNDQ
jgi:hypothetical protein